MEQVGFEQTTFLACRTASLLSYNDAITIDDIVCNKNTNAFYWSVSQEKQSISLLDLRHNHFFLWDCLVLFKYHNALQKEA